MREFSILSDIEFEELAADLLAAEISMPVERFAAGRDKGIDLRWQSGEGIAQCKHYPRSTFSQLMAAAQSEIPKVEKLNPRDYRFITSFDLSVGQKEKLFDLFQQWMTSVASVISGRDLDGLITRHEEVERRHPKLWLSTGTQLFWSLHSNLANRTEALKDRVARNLPRYVVNHGYAKARALLDKHRVCLIAGVPGIGKTVLAQVLVADAITQGYEPVEVSEDISEAWAALRNDQRQIFLYDDFLGQISFSERLGKNEDKRLSDFIEKVSGGNRSLLIMTTREYILQDARRVYDHLDALDRSMHFILALEDYTRADRARILYNHLWHANLSDRAMNEVAHGGYKEIVDHSGYSPRLIEYCTSIAFDIESPGYVARFVDALDHPARLWSTAFEKHLTLEQQLLLFVLATFPVQVGVDEQLTAHRSLCLHMKVPVTRVMSREALAVTEGTFVTIGRVDERVVLRFHNPSIAEFTLDRLADDQDLLADIIASAPYFEQLRTIFSYFTKTDVHVPRLGGLIDHLRVAYTKRLCETFDSPSPERRRQWSPQRGTFHAEPPGRDEDRLRFAWNLPADLQPAHDWLIARTQEVINRWRQKVGGKTAAYRFYRSLLQDVGQEDICHAMRPILEDWYSSTLEETDDWTIYLEWLGEIHGHERLNDPELARRFEEHARDELDRWSPEPPDIDDPITYAEQFNLDDLIEDLEQVATAASDQTDMEVERNKDHTALPLRDAVAGSDKVLEQMFSRLAKDS